MTLRSRLPILLSALTFAAATWSSGLGGPVVSPAHALDPFTVSEQMVTDHKAVFASVQSIDELTARARLGGVVTALSVDEGSSVRIGDPIAVIIDETLALTLQSLDAQLAGVEAELAQAETDLDRAQTLRAQGVAPQTQVDNAETQLQVLRRRAEQVTAERSVLIEQTQQGTVRAPASGRILDVPVKNGSIVLPGDTVAIIADNRFVLRLELPERHARFITKGDTVAVGPRGLDPLTNVATASDSWTSGTIAQVYPRLTQGRVRADVQVDGLGDFFVGERVLVRVATGTRSAIVVPNAYVITRWGVSFVNLQDEGLIPVQTGEPHTADGLEILSGLHADDVLIAPDTQP